MKKIPVLLALLLASPICAQITLEHSYNPNDYRLQLLQIDSNEFKYVISDLGDSFFLYNLDHSLYLTLTAPIHNAIDTTLPDSLKPVQYYELYHVSRSLFNMDNEIEYLIGTSNSAGDPLLYVFNEGGDTLFECSKCALHNNSNFIGKNADGQGIASLVNTENGAKMIIHRKDSRKTEIYSLPGKLPTCNTKLSVTDAPTIISRSSPSTSAYPNPSNGKIRVAYSLPEGVTTGELLITATDGREVKRYRVGNMFNDILIEKSELASGAYFYKLVTERGESEARKFVITN